MASVYIGGIFADRATVIVNGEGIARGVEVRVFVRTGKKTDSGTEVYDKPHTATGSSLSVDITGLDPKTWYTANASLDGGSTWIGAKEFETEPEEIERPDDWYWWHDVSPGEPVLLGAEEWNAFCDHINAMRIYAGAREYGFDRVREGGNIRAWDINEAFYAIIGTPGFGEKYIPKRTVVAGDPISASYLEGLRKAINAVE